MSSGVLRPSTPSAVGESFDDVVLPHLDAAYRLARWLMRNEHDAEDVVQEASLRAFRYFRTFTGEKGVPGSSASCATPVVAGADTACTYQPTPSMNSGTAAFDLRPILKRYCSTQTPLR
jgi:hypothetical protein